VVDGSGNPITGQLTHPFTLTIPAAADAVLYFVNAQNTLTDAKTTCTVPSSAWNAGYLSVDVCHLSTFLTVTPASGGGSGEPVFSGFHGQHLEFSGIIGNFYHIFSDPYISMNALFGDANPEASYGGTVMKMLSFVVYGNTIVLSRNDSAVTINDKRTSDYSTELPNCVYVVIGRFKVTIATPEHYIVVYYKKKHTEHINTKYLDFTFTIKGAHTADLYGGIMGGTVDANSEFVADEAGWVTSSLLSADAITNKYTQQPMDCNQQLKGDQTSNGHKRNVELTSYVEHDPEMN